MPGFKREISSSVAQFANARFPASENTSRCGTAGLSSAFPGHTAEFDLPEHRYATAFVNDD
jgi:hypothetical protein